MEALLKKMNEVLEAAKFRYEPDVTEALMAIDDAGIETEVVDEDYRTGEGRWNSYHICVFRVAGLDELYGIEYERGLTENQYADNDFKVHLVEAKEVTVTEYSLVRS